jgi:hypothetical protein
MAAAECINIIQPAQAYCQINSPWNEIKKAAADLACSLFRRGWRVHPLEKERDIPLYRI